jgi:hypothetical protein
LLSQRLKLRDLGIQLQQGFALAKWGSIPHGISVGRIVCCDLVVFAIVIGAVVVGPLASSQLF